MTEKERQILQIIKEQPFLSQAELAERCGLSRSAVAGYISQLMKKGEIIGRAYILREHAPITCIGGANVDWKAQALDPFEMYTSNPGKVDKSTGGVARNMAENLARLGVEVQLVSIVGRDEEGEWLREQTAANGVDVHGIIQSVTSRTGSYMAVINGAGEMVTAIADMGIYDELTPDQLSHLQARLAKSDWHVLDTNIPKETIESHIKFVKERGGKVVVDPVSNVKTMKLRDTLPLIDVFVPNRYEAAALTGIATSTLDGCIDAVQYFRQLGVELPIITMAEQGVLFANYDGIFQVTCNPVPVKDVTGAGDAFAAGLIYALHQGEEDLMAIQCGMNTANITIQSSQTVAPEMSLDTMRRELKQTQFHVKRLSKR